MNRRGFLAGLIGSIFAAPELPVVAGPGRFVEPVLRPLFAASFQVGIPRGVMDLIRARLYERICRDEIAYFDSEIRVRQL